MNFKKEPWRLVVGIAAIAYIVYMWVDKDLLSAFSGISAEQALPMAATSAAVTIAKVLLLAGAVLVIKLIANKLKK